MRRLRIDHDRSTRNEYEYYEQQNSQQKERQQQQMTILRVKLHQNRNKIMQCTCHSAHVLKCNFVVSINRWNGFTCL